MAKVKNKAIPAISAESVVGTKFAEGIPPEDPKLEAEIFGQEEPVSATPAEPVLEPDEDSEEDDDASAETGIMRPWDEVREKLMPTQTPVAPTVEVKNTAPKIRVTQDLGVVLLVKQGSLSTAQLAEQSRGLRQYGPAVQVIVVDDFNQVVINPKE